MKWLGALLIAFSWLFVFVAVISFLLMLVPYEEGTPSEYEDYVILTFWGLLFAAMAALARKAGLRLKRANLVREV